MRKCAHTKKTYTNRRETNQICRRVIKHAGDMYAHIEIVVAFLLITFFACLVTVKADFHEICRNFILPATQTFLDPPGPPKTSGKPFVRDQIF